MQIDVFSHILPARYLERLERAVGAGELSERVDGYAPWIHEDPALTDLGARFSVMDAFPDYRQVLTLAVPPVEEVGAADLASAVNEELAALVAAHPDRFVGFAAALPMADPDAASLELERSVRELGAFGAQVHTNVAGHALDDPRFDVVLAAADGLGATIWIHPTRSPVWADYPAEARSKYGIWWSLGWPYETSVCMARLVYSGIVGRYPGISFVAHHAGAMVPHFSGRLASPLEDEARHEVMARLGEEPLTLFRRFHTDTAMFGAPHAVRCAVEFFGPDHVLFGTDMPLGGPKVVGDTVADVESTGLEPDELDKIFEGNAHRLFARTRRGRGGGTP